MASFKAVIEAADRLAEALTKAAVAGVRLAEALERRDPPPPPPVPSDQSWFKPDPKPPGRW